MTRSKHPSTTCLFCEKRLSNQQGLFRHIRTHIFEKPHACQICDRAFNQIGGLSFHMLASHGTERSFKCDLCEMTFKFPKTLERHKTRQHSANQFQCSSCTKIFKCSSYLKAHEFSMHSSYADRPFGCEICEKRFVTKQNYMGHLHCHTTEKPFKCEICGKTSSTKHDLIKHTIIHGEHKFRCESCPKTFATERQHTLRIHSDLKKAHHCPICNRGFFLANDLKQHQTVHNEEKLFQCSICMARFKSKHALGSHTTRVHGVKSMFPCPHCPRIYRSDSGIKFHIEREHAAGGPLYSCLFCSKKAFSKGNLMQHIRSHTKERPYFCEMCENSFFTQRVLEDHFRSCHTLERPYKCDPCGKSYMLV